LFDDLNQERAARGLPALAWDPALANLGTRWSENMKNGGGLKHRNTGTDFASIGTTYSTTGENVGVSRGNGSAATVHGMWMKSDGHRRNILQPGFDRVGIGAFCDADGALWVTQEFAGGPGRSLDSATPPAGSVAGGSGPTCKD
jgi:uncharacterized protein YkwD